MGPQEGYVFLEIQRLINLINLEVRPDQILSGYVNAGLAFKLKNKNQTTNAEIGVHAIYKIPGKVGFYYFKGSRLWNPDYFPSEGRMYTNNSTSNDPVTDFQFSFQPQLNYDYGSGDKFCFSFISKEDMWKVLLEHTSDSPIILIPRLIHCEIHNCGIIKDKVFTFELQEMNRRPIELGETAPCPPFWDPNNVPQVGLNKKFIETLKKWSAIKNDLEILYTSEDFCK